MNVLAFASVTATDSHRENAPYIQLVHLRLKLDAAAKVLNLSGTILASPDLSSLSFPFRGDFAVDMRGALGMMHNETSRPGVA